MHAVLIDPLTTEIRRIVREEVERILAERQAMKTAPASDGEVAPVDLKRWFTPKDVMSYLGVAAQTLANWRSTSVGPPFSRAGRLVRYWGEDVEAFMRGSE